MQYDPKTPFRSMIDSKKGTVARQIFADEGIYRLELERIFARAWNFMCHESQLPNPGDFLLSYIGEESVICVRDRKGGFQVMLNSCRHRGNAVCRAEKGNVRSFMCTYHGWTYGLDGSLIGVPGYKDLYHEQLDKSQWGLIRAAKVASYKGFVFATMDPEAPELEDYLGPVGRFPFDVIESRGGVKAVDGVLKNVIGCNWKLAVDNVFDWYHARITHASASYAQPGQLGHFTEHRVVLGEYGHAISGPRMSQKTFESDARRAQGGGVNVDGALGYEWRQRPEVVEALGELHETRGHHHVFPNMWITSDGAQIGMRFPKGPSKTELWWQTLAPKEFSEEDVKRLVHRSNHTFGPAGMLEQEDGENWDQSTRAMRGPIAQAHPLHYAMNLGLARAKRTDSGAAYIDTNVNEHAQLWSYRAWAEWMDAENWSALRLHHSAVPVQGETV